MKHLIMCGGFGSRFWPLSTPDMPKQFLKLLGNKSLLRLTVDRLSRISNIDNIFLVTSKKYKDLIHSEIPVISDDNILYEPSARNTTAAIYYSLKKISIKDNSSIIGIYPADHFIKKESEFISSVSDAYRLIENDKDRIYTFGIKPNYPSTSYGYIKCISNASDSSKDTWIAGYMEGDFDKVVSLMADSIQWNGPNGSTVGIEVLKESLSLIHI